MKRIVVSCNIVKLPQRASPSIGSPGDKKVLTVSTCLQSYLP